MKEKIKIIILLIVFFILIVGISIYMNNKSRNEDAALSKDIKDNIEAEEGNVIEVTSENFEEEVLKSDKKVLIDFYATWCMPCKQLSPTIDQISLEREDIKFVRIDVDKNEKLAGDYGIMAMPTLVLIENGEEINRSVGLIDRLELIRFIEK